MARRFGQICSRSLRNTTYSEHPHGSFVIVRLVTPLGLAHAGSVERYAPYNRIVLAQLQMRREAPAIIQEASAQGVASSIIERKLCAADHASDY